MVLIEGRAFGKASWGGWPWSWADGWVSTSRPGKGPSGRRCGMAEARRRDQAASVTAVTGQGNRWESRGSLPSVGLVPQGRALCARALGGPGALRGFLERGALRGCPGGQGPPTLTWEPAPMEWGNDTFPTWAGRGQRHFPCVESRALVAEPRASRKSSSAPDPQLRGHGPRSGF